MDALKLCVSCKACRNECPTGVDMAKMKIEVLAARAEKFGLSLRDRLVAFLPRYASICRARCAARQPAQREPAVAKAVRNLWRDQRRARPAGMAERRVRSCGRSLRPGRRRRGGAVRRHFQSRLRAGESRGGAERADRSRFSRASAASRFRASARCAAAARSLPPALSITHARSSNARSQPSLLSPHAACRSSDWSRAAC